MTKQSTTINIVHPRCATVLLIWREGSSLATPYTTPHALSYKYPIVSTQLPPLNTTQLTNQASKLEADSQLVVSFRNKSTTNKQTPPPQQQHPSNRQATTATTTTTTTTNNNVLVPRPVHVPSRRSRLEHFVVFLGRRHD